jgi:small GTP-binding protein
METFKVVVTGPFGAGKTTFINAVSDTPVVRTETGVSDETAALKQGTTVALDYGSITIGGDADDEDGAELLIFGTPGQVRFDFMWRILFQGADGFVVLVDASRPESVSEAVAMLGTFRGMDPDVNFVVGANRTSEGTAGRAELDGLAVAFAVPLEQIVTVDVITADSCVELLLTLLDRVLARTDAAAVLSRA